MGAVEVNNMEIYRRVKLERVLKIMLKNPENWESPINRLIDLSV